MPYHLDRNSHGSGNLVYFRDSVATKLLITENLPPK